MHLANLRFIRVTAIIVKYYSKIIASIPATIPFTIFV